MSPFCGSAGWSERSPEKQEVVGHLMAMLLTATKNMRAGRPFVYVDMNAGPGIYESGMFGSPLVALDTARRLGQNISALLYEVDPCTRDDVGGLCDVVKAHGFSARIRGHHATAPADCVALAAELGAPVHGLVYSDPNPDRDLIPNRILATIYRNSAYYKVDALIYVSATNYGRQRQYRGRYLLDDLREIGKKETWLRIPIAQHRWTFAFLTNWSNSPDLRRYGFRKVGTPEGDALAEDLNLTKREASERSQPGLFA